jgi:hypothetical protein
VGKLKGLVEGSYRVLAMECSGAPAFEAANEDGSERGKAEKERKVFGT